MPPLSLEPVVSTSPPVRQDPPPPTLPPRPPRWVAVVVILAVGTGLVDFASGFFKPLVSETLRRTWWNLGNSLIVATLALALWGLAAWRRRLGWVLAASGATLGTLLLLEYSISRWGLPYEMTPRRLASSAALVGSVILLALGLVLAKSDAGQEPGRGLALVTTILLLLQALAGNLLTLLGALFQTLSSETPPFLWDLARPSFVLYRSLEALPALVMASLLWYECRPRAGTAPWRGPGSALLLLGVVGSLTMAASLSGQLLHAHQELVQPWRFPSPPAESLAVAIHAAGAGLLSAGLLALGRLGWPVLGVAAAVVVGALAGLVPLGRLLTGDPDAAGFSPLVALPAAVLLGVVVRTRQAVPQTTAWAAGIFLGLSVPLAALSTDGVTSVFHGMDRLDAALWAPGALLSVRALVIVGAYALFSLHLAQLRTAGVAGSRDPQTPG